MKDSDPSAGAPAGGPAVDGALGELERDLDAVTGELVEVQDQLLAMYDLAGALRGYLEPDALLAVLVSEAMRLVGTAGGFAALGDDEGRAVTSPELRLEPADVRRLVELCGRGTDVVVGSAPSVGRVMLVPIPLHDRPSAVLGLIRDPESGFTAPEQKMMGAIAAYGGAQLEGVLLHQESLRRTRVELEFELARSIQADLSPALPAGHPGVDVYAESRAAHVVGGDFFDFALGDDHRLMCLLGDVAGKGIPAALLVAMTRAIMRTASREMEGSTPGTVLNRANADLYQDFSHLGRFATVFLACFEPTTRRVVTANAGHSPVVYRPADGQARLVYANAVPIGVLHEWDAADAALRLAPGDLLMVATDGFSEAEDPRTGELFGNDRLLEIVDRVAARDAAGIGAALFQATDAFTSGAEADDDQTVLILRGVDS
jgi:sigma-B regulation protein RsbU (phosphoserine phosphatase)